MTGYKNKAKQKLHNVNCILAGKNMLEKQHGWEVIWCITLCQKASFIEITITRLDDISALRHFFFFFHYQQFLPRGSPFFCIFITTLHHVIYMRIHALLNQGPKKNPVFWGVILSGSNSLTLLPKSFSLLQRSAPLSMVLPTFLGRPSGNPWHLMSCEARAEKRWGATTYNSFEINEMLVASLVELPIVKFYGLRLEIRLQGKEVLGN